MPTLIYQGPADIYEDGDVSFTKGERAECEPDLAARCLARSGHQFADVTNEPEPVEEQPLYTPPPLRAEAGEEADEPVTSLAPAKTKTKESGQEK